MERIDLGGGAKFSVFRTLEAPKLQRMQASLFRNEGPRPEKMSPGRKWAVDESSMSTETEGEPRRVRARQSPSRPISRPKTSLFGKVPTMELSETVKIWKYVIVFSMLISRESHSMDVSLVLLVGTCCNAFGTRHLHNRSRPSRISRASKTRSSMERKRRRQIHYSHAEGHSDSVSLVRVA